MGTSEFVKSGEKATDVTAMMVAEVLARIGFKGPYQEVYRRADEMGRQIIEMLKLQRADQILLRPEGMGKYPTAVEVDAFQVSCPAEIVARIAAWSNLDGDGKVVDAHIRKIEIGCISADMMMFPLMTISNGRLNVAGKFAIGMTRIRQALPCNDNRR